MSQTRSQSNQNISVSVICFNYHSPSTNINDKQKILWQKAFCHILRHRAFTISLTTVTSISNYHSPFKEREVSGRLNVVAKNFCHKLCHETINISLAIHFKPLNNIFNQCYHFHQGHIQTTLAHLTHSKLPKPTALFNTTRSTILSTIRT